MGKAYTEEQMINRVILLHYVYNGNANKMEKAEDVSRLALIKWKSLYHSKAIQLVGIGEPEEEALKKSNVPSLRELFNKLLVRIDTTSVPSELAHLATAANKIHAMLKIEGEVGDMDKEWEKAKQKLLKFK